ncbi:MAG: hypothetical protein JXB24_07300 [Bacteroidales bacterium]|nr:hypothetical protein [Bacteroidales bacterium]
MKINKVLPVCFALLFASSAYGQKIKVTSGQLSTLKGIKALKIEYDYSDLAVGKFDNEEDYINKRVTEMNDKEPGTGDSWKIKWFDDRTYRFEPKFEELFSKYAESIESGQKVNAEIIMNVHTIFIEPGYNVGISRMPASINLDVTFIKGDEELAVISITKSPGSDAMGYDFDTGYRISEAYAKAGKSLAKYLDKIK